jgi:hypothetical protein
MVQYTVVGSRSNANENHSAALSVAKIKVKYGIGQITILIALLLTTISAYSQITIYYDLNCDITMRELATHYRIANVDTAAGKFIGEVRDFWLNDSLSVKLSYDSNGIKNGLASLRNSDGSLIAEGQYLNGLKSGIWKVHDKKQMLINFNGEGLRNIRALTPLRVA